MSAVNSADRRRVLVTGAAGFLGSHLVDRLLARGDRVVGLDNLMTGRSANLDRAREHPRFDFVHHDVLEPFRGLFDEVWHLACPASPPRYQRDPIGTAKICFTGTLNALDVAQSNGARFFLASTSEVYGDPEVHPQPEGYRGAVNPDGPRACYDEGKRIAETLSYDYHRTYGLDVRVARIFNTYGPRMDPADGRVVSNFIVQALEGEPLTLFGDGSQTRSFCYYEDLISGFVALMERAEMPDGPVNIGNPGEFTVAELARQVAAKVKARTGRDTETVFRDLPVDDPQQRRPDIARAGELLGWSPEIALSEGLDRTIEHFEAELRGNRP